jgi:flagellar protein FlaG
MASVSVSHLILFIASMIIAAGVAGVFTTSVDQLANAIEDQGVQVSDNVRTSISIISDTGSENIYNTTEENVTLYVKNIGTQNLDADKRQVDVLVDGRFVTDDDLSMRVLDTNDEFTWGTNEVVELKIARTLDTGDHRAKVIVNGDEEVIEFRVTNE